MMQRNLRSVFGQVRAAQVRRRFSSYPPTESIEEEIAHLKKVLAVQKFLSRGFGWAAGFGLGRAIFGDFVTHGRNKLEGIEKELIRKEKVLPQNVFLENQRPKLKAIDEKVEKSSNLAEKLTNLEERLSKLEAASTHK